MNLVPWQGGWAWEGPTSKEGAFASRELNGIQGCLQESGRCPRATAVYHRPLSSQALATLFLCLGLKLQMVGRYACAWAYWDGHPFPFRCYFSPPPLFFPFGLCFDSIRG